MAFLRTVAPTTMRGSDRLPCSPSHIRCNAGMALKQHAFLSNVRTAIGVICMRLPAQEGVNTFDALRHMQSNLTVRPSYMSMQSLPGVPARSEYKQQSCQPTARAELLTPRHLSGSYVIVLYCLAMTSHVTSLPSQDALCTFEQ